LPGELADELKPLLTVRHVLNSQPFHGINRKVRMHCACTAHALHMHCACTAHALRMHCT
jgi:hypothetical protein